MHTENLSLSLSLSLSPPSKCKQRIKRMYVIKFLPVSPSLSVYLSFYAIKIDTKDKVNSCIKFSLSLSLALSLCAACFKSICEVSKANDLIWVKTGLSMPYIPSRVSVDFEV